MSQRRALLQLHNEVLLRAIGELADRQELGRRLELLGLGGNTLPAPELPPGSESRLGAEVVKALGDLAAAPEQAPVAPIETLQLLVALSNDLRSSGGLQALPDHERAAVELVATGLLDADAPPEHAATLLQVIDSIPEDDGVIRVRGLGEGLRPAPVTGPKPPPDELADPETVGDLLTRAGVSIGVQTPQLLASLATHPVVDVEARIYRAVVNGQAEYPVHLRTTIRFAGRGQQDLDRFERILKPVDWPTYNSFWKAMDEVPLGSSAAASGEVPEPLEIAAAEFDQSIADFFADRWDVVGTYREKVGFEGDADLYPVTYLYFAGRPRLDGRSVLSYTLADRSACALEVDDGCIEVALGATGIDVVTTKSLYVSGAGTDTELAGIMAYIAVYAGWGTHTLALVSNAIKN